jgi:hypothetical protein
MLSRPRQTKNQAVTRLLQIASSPLNFSLNTFLKLHFPVIITTNHQQVTDARQQFRHICRLLQKITGPQLKCLTSRFRTLIVRNNDDRNSANLRINSRSLEYRRARKTWTLRIQQNQIGMSAAHFSQQFMHIMHLTNRMITRQLQSATHRYRRRTAVRNQNSRGGIHFTP